MKNLLAEAARSASDAGTTEALSESGSFDTTLQDFDTTANDEAALGDPGDRAIASEPEYLELEEPSPQWDDLDVAEGLQAASHAVVSAIAEPEIEGKSQIPTLVRLSPYVCALLAVLSAVLWQSYLNIAASHDAAALGATLVQTRQEPTEFAVAPVSAVERFPYIQPLDKQSAGTQ